MELRDILVFLDGGSAAEGRLQLAINIARNHEACLSAVFLQNGQVTASSRGHAAPWLELAAGPLIPGAIATSHSAVLADDAEEEFRERLRSLRIEGDWHAPESDVPATSLRDPLGGPNPTGHAVVWWTQAGDEKVILCFAPGNEL
jgi:hypothetical protein